ncbi:MAG: SUF system NifU family Fe-S cluster assembly protein [Varibaculum sp.]|nr:SUF system NifU family Fe-S cluster assembly protein [Varibaculum sp.]
MDSLQQLYQQAILDHSREKHGSGVVPPNVVSSHQVNPTCGDEVTLTAQLGEDERINSITWDGDGCSISQASLSMMTDLVQGKTVSETMKLWDEFEEMMHSRGQVLPDELLEDLEDAAALHGTSQFPNRVKCALLGWMALRDVIAQQESKQPQTETAVAGERSNGE